MPDAQPTPQISVDFGDVVAGRAYLGIPFVGKLLLAHWAGAPWSDKDEDACLHALQVEVLAFSVSFFHQWLSATPVESLKH